MKDRELIAAKLAEAGVSLSDEEIDQLIPEYEVLLQWQSILEEMLKPESEPALIHSLRARE